MDIYTCIVYKAAQAQNTFMRQSVLYGRDHCHHPSTLALALPSVALANDQAECQTECGQSYGLCMETGTQAAGMGCAQDLSLYMAKYPGLDAGAAYDLCFAEQQAASNLACSDTFGDCMDHCDQTFGGDSSSGYLMESVDCPPGTAPGPLGTCQPVLEGTVPEDLDPDDGCPGGTVRGPDDSCVPVLLPVHALPVNDIGAWAVVCPPGTKPGPIDACVPDFSTGAAPLDPDALCPPGFVPGPDDACVPAGDNALTRGTALEMVQTLAARGMFSPEMQPLSTELVRMAGAVVTTDVEVEVEWCAAGYTTD